MTATPSRRVVMEQVFNDLLERLDEIEGTQVREPSVWLHTRHQVFLWLNEQMELMLPGCYICRPTDPKANPEGCADCEAEHWAAAQAEAAASGPRWVAPDGQRATGRGEHR